MSNLTHNRRLRGGPFLALGSAFLFVASTPVGKLLLAITDPLLLAGLLYLASGAGLAFVAMGGRFACVQGAAARGVADLPWLTAIVIFGGIRSDRFCCSDLYHRHRHEYA